MKLSRLSIYIASTLFAACRPGGKAPETYLDPALPVNRRVELLLKEMTLAEKIGQMCSYVGEAAPVPAANTDEDIPYVLSLGDTADLVKHGKIGSFIKVADYEKANDLQGLAERSRLKIPLLIANDAMHGHGMYQGAVTIYPTEIGIASSFETTLAYRIAKYTAREMRATGNHWTFSPNIEVVRDPRWGRTGETFGEDPHLVSLMGRSMTKGYQGADFGEPDNVLSCAKHFVGGGIADNGLNGAPADISERTLYEVFFPPFIQAIEAGAYTIMPAHNEINGIPCHAHRRYLTQLIRRTWNFQGFFVSDWLDIQRLFSVHRIAATEKEADRIAVLAGLDMHIHGPGFFDNVKESVDQGSIPMARIDDAARKILYAKFQLGLFENRYVDPTQVANSLLKKEYLELALEAARKSIVLLKNANNLLPLDKEIGSLFITGPNADSQALLGDWTMLQPADNVTTVLEGIRRAVSPRTQVDYLSSGQPETTDTALLANARERAGASDVSIVVLGENSVRFDPKKTSGENLDRPALELPGGQLDLLQAVAGAGKPVIVVLVNGGPVASPWMVDNVEGLIEAWEPGMSGGQAVADVIFGDYNPGGRLPITFPRTVGHIRSFYNYKPSAFHRGQFYQSEKQPLFEFGFGLSFTQFQYSHLQLPEKIGLKDDLEFRLTVENTGVRAGDEIVLVYLNDKISSVTTPVKKLVAFNRIHLPSREKQELAFVIPNSSFRLFDKDMNSIIEPGQFDIIIGNDLLRSTIMVE
jgi:beta-glucosidase